MAATQALASEAFGVAPEPSENQPDAISEEPERRPRLPKTYFIAEGALGLEMTNGAGPSYGGLLGVGGKLPWTPLRLYLFAEVSDVTLGQRSLTIDGDRIRAEQSDVLDVSGGLRLYIPTFRPVRFFVDAAVGQSRVSTLVEETAGFIYADEWASVAVVAAGAQARVFHHLSVGGRARLALRDSSLLLEGPSGSLLATVTAHF